MNLDNKFFLCDLERIHCGNLRCAALDVQGSQSWYPVIKGRQCRSKQRSFYSEQTHFRYSRKAEKLLVQW